jgi:DNA repair protein RecN (Recombination protein N)
MLVELRIRNLAIIDALDLTFSRGLNILTGETGAGKSIVLNAVLLLLGERAGEDWVRSSEEEAAVEALFDLSGSPKTQQKILERSSKPAAGEEDLLLVRRVISRAGRGRAYLNGNLVTLGMLAELGEELLSIYGQHEHQSLQKPETHIEILDDFGGFTALREQYRSRYEAFLARSEEMRRLREEQDRRARDRELTAFQSREIESAGLEPGEEESLRGEREILVHSQKLMAFAEAAQDNLYVGDGSALERIQTVLRQGREMAGLDRSLEGLIRNLEALQIQTEEVAFSLRDYGRRVESNPARIEEVENRLDALRQLKKKYGPSVEDILIRKEQLDRELRALCTGDEDLLRLEAGMEPLRREVEALAGKLTAERRRAAGELKRAVEKELASLGMKKTVFEIQFEPQPLSPKGAERAEFLLSPNVGEKVKPLARIASGGELSRIMLALKRILAVTGGREVLVFDEVDSGVGGAVAEVIGRKLRELSLKHQVLCVTHLPQIASFADAHFQVRKEVRDGRTQTRVQRLEGEAVVEEVARMLGGMKLTDKTRDHAREMIDTSRRPV